MEKSFKGWQLALCLVILCFQQSTVAMHGRYQEDPLIAIRYRNAFDQSKIHQKFALYLEHLGCAKNVGVSGSCKPAPMGMSKTSPVVSPEPYNHDLLNQAYQLDPYFCDCQRPAFRTYAGCDAQIQKAYQEACLWQWKKARLWAIGEPIRDLIVTGSLTIISAAIVGGLLSGCGAPAAVAGAAAGSVVGSAVAHSGAGHTAEAQEPRQERSMATGFAVMNAVFNNIMRCDDGIRSCANLANQPYAKIDRYEEYFAKNMCFIPQKMWQRITETFAAARTNQNGQSDQLKFLEKALDLTFYKPKEPCTIKDGMTLADARNEIEHRIDTFFENDYQLPSDGDRTSLGDCRIKDIKFPRIHQLARQ